MKLINEKSYSTKEQDTKCVLEQGTNRFSVGYACDGDLFVTMDSLDESNIKYDDEFNMKMIISKVENEDLFNVFLKLYKNIKEEHNKYRTTPKKTNTVDRQVTVYSHEPREAVVANSLTITLGGNLILLSFKTQKPRVGYKPDIYSSVYIPIRLRRTWSETRNFEELFESLKAVIDEDTKMKKPLTYEPSNE